MNAGKPGEWDAERARAQLTGRPQFDPDGLYFITYGGTPADATPIGTACAWSSPQEPGTGILHMVCVLPEHRGRRLGYPLCLAVLHRFRQRGLPRARLGTGEHRLGAVKIYLALGFQPVYRHPLNPEQWLGVVRRLGWTQPLTPFVEDPAGNAYFALKSGTSTSTPPFSAD
jgi:GNAT superfamily N-acetyltransferase